jgi:hypothetical protein
MLEDAIKERDEVSRRDDTPQRFIKLAVQLPWIITPWREGHHGGL